MASIKTAIAVTVAVLLCSPSLAADLNLGGEVPVCTENLNSDVVVMKSAKDRV